MSGSIIKRIEPEGKMPNGLCIHGRNEMKLNVGKNDFGDHAVFKTSLYYMLKIKSGSVKVKLPNECTLNLMASQYQPIQEKRNGFTKIHVVPDSDEDEIVSVMNYFQFVFKNQ